MPERRDRVIRLAVIGLGYRGMSFVKRKLDLFPDVAVTSLCDVSEERMREACGEIRARGGDVRCSSDFREALNAPGLDAVLINTGWESHREIALYAMRKGIAVGCEVGREYSIEACRELVAVQQSTGTPYMYLENCCFGREEALATEMARAGCFGSIVFCSGSYSHDLRDSLVRAKLEGDPYRFDNYASRTGDSYPTHDLGPIAFLLNLNRGNRIRSLVSASSKAAGLNDYMQDRDDVPEALKRTRFRQGDLIETLLTCENGELIRLTLDTTLPVIRSRNLTVRGTRGFYLQATNSVHIGPEPVETGSADYYRSHIDNAKAYENDYLPACLRNLTEAQRNDGHGGMDWLTYHSFFRAVAKHTPVPIDVYDAATWMAVSVLSEQSILCGGTPQEMPDFTDGAWKNRPSAVPWGTF